ncbi:hypothetical protein ACOJQI_11280 [Bacillus salacetis]|uniref:hypothetical protein n=1 Tax=Bacillus salacetis TaxID=2315464 RepID=UPI003B9E30B0
MFKKLSLFLLLITLLGACSQQNDKESQIETTNLNLEVVENVLKGQGFELGEAPELPSENVFIQKLNGVAPDLYSVEGNLLSVYEFPSASARGKGIEKFEEKTATADLVEHQVYGVNNILVFYVSADEKVQSELHEALQKLDTPD